MTQKDVVTIILPNGTKFYAEKLAMVGLNVGENGPPQNNQNTVLIYGDVGMDELASMHHHLDEAFSGAADAMIGRIKEQAKRETKQSEAYKEAIKHFQGDAQEAILEKLIDRIAEKIATKVQS